MTDDERSLMEDAMGARDHLYKQTTESNMRMVGYNIMGWEEMQEGAKNISALVNEKKAIIIKYLTNNMTGMSKEITDQIREIMHDISQMDPTPSTQQITIEFVMKINGVLMDSAVELTAFEEEMLDDEEDREAWEYMRDDYISMLNSQIDRHEDMLEQEVECDCDEEFIIEHARLLRRLTMIGQYHEGVH